MGLETSVFVSRLYMRNLNLLAFIVSEMLTFLRTGGHGQIDLAIDADQEYLSVIWSETLPSACYILFNESSLPFYSTSKGYKHSNKFLDDENNEIYPLQYIIYCII